MPNKIERSQGLTQASFVQQAESLTRKDPRRFKQVKKASDPDGPHDTVYAVLVGGVAGQEIVFSLRFVPAAYSDWGEDTAEIEAPMYQYVENDQIGKPPRGVKVNTESTGEAWVKWSKDRGLKSFFSEIDYGLIGICYLLGPEDWIQKDLASHLIDFSREVEKACEFFKQVQIAPATKSR